MLKDRGIVLLALGQTLIWACLYYSFPAMLLLWEQDLGWSKVDLTGAVTLSVLMSGLVSPISGRLIDHGRGDLLMALSSVLGGCGLLALSQVTSLGAFYATWAVIGVAMSGCLYEPCFALVTRARGANAKQAIILITLVAGFAGTVSFPLTNVLANAFGWRTAVVLLGVFVIVVVSPMLWFGAHAVESKRDVPAAGETTVAVSSNAFLRLPEFGLLAAGFGLIAMVHSATLQHLLPILNEQGLANSTAVLAASFIGPAQVAGRLVMVAAGQRVSHRNMTIVACVCIGAAVLLLRISATSPVLLALAILCFGGAYGTISILRPVVAREILGDAQFGAKSGALALPFFAGSALAPFLGALVWRSAGYNTLLVLLAGIAALGCALYVLSDAYGRRRSQA